MNKICIYGAGAIGGFLACSLQKAGSDVSLIARGQHLDVIKEKGLTLISKNGEEKFKFNASQNTSDLGFQDYVIICLKAHSISNIVNDIVPLVSDKTTVITAVNGIPWWYFYKAKTKTSFDEKPFYPVDEDGKIWNTLSPQKALGCVVYPACEIISPGKIKHLSGDRFSLGEPSGEKTERLKIISKILIQGGLKAPQKTRIRDEIWIKIWGNCSFNLVSALTGATLDEIGNNKHSRKIVVDLMEECKNIGESIGINFPISIDERINGASKITGHIPSTRQDIENRKPLEIDPIFTALLDLARKLKVEAKTLTQMTTLLKMKASKLNLYDRKY